MGSPMGVPPMGRHHVQDAVGADPCAVLRGSFWNDGDMGIPAGVAASGKLLDSSDGSHWRKKLAGRARSS
jgi:hypothetical protein